ncbi:MULTISPECIES: hypothetical protein [Helicobacter]|uniref:hypothetical protein n=1 Tax=Helicobacter TaxID=209 RepID=UPI000512AA1C|nr:MULTISPECIES: hypothetical protein [Helicobacter]TLD86152.1 hypothetical protein LS66_009705 [Helicobacter sp. MIT 03-1614]
MSFVNKIISQLHPYADSAYFEDRTKTIKDHISILMNTKNEGISLMNFADLSLEDLDINTKNLALLMSEKIYHLVNTYETRAKILNIEYDESFAPWQISFFMRMRHVGGDLLDDFNIQIVFKNNRYCDVM